MRIAVIGGGPAGLYFAILMKRDRPDARVTVVERNRADDTFGFGVVFSDQALDAFRDADAPSYRAITDSFAYWDDVEVHFGGAVHRIGGNGFCGCSRRTLLHAPAGARARPGRGAGVPAGGGAGGLPRRRPDRGRRRHQLARSGNAGATTSRRRWTCAPTASPGWAAPGPSTPSPSSSASGRRASSSPTATSTRPAPAPGCWKPTPRPSPAPGSRRWTRPRPRASWRRCSGRSWRGTGCQTNRSLWRRFPMIRCARWTKGNVVLLGDAKATAHFSIGSGTKLAMEDAIALHAAFAAGGGVPECLARFEAARREDVERTQHAADVSLVWFEQLRRFRGIPPDALRLRADDARQGDHLGQPGAARPRLRRRRCARPSRRRSARAASPPTRRGRPPSSRSDCAA